MAVDDSRFSELRSLFRPRVVGTGRLNSMDYRVVRKYFYQKWRGHSLRNSTRREIVFLLLGADRHALQFRNLLRLTFIRLSSVLDDGEIIGLFGDKDMTCFVKFASALPSGHVLMDMHLQQILPLVQNDTSSLLAYLDLPRIFHEVGVDLTSAGPDPMASTEAFFLKLLWPGYTENDEKYVAITIAGILATRAEGEQDNMTLPPYSMHLTEVGMHLKSLEAVDASLAWALPALKNEGLRLARFLARSDTVRYFSIRNSPFHHSDKVVSLNVPAIVQDAERLWGLHDIAVYLHGGEELGMSPSGVEAHMDYVVRLCAETALSEDLMKTFPPVSPPPRLTPAEVVTQVAVQAPGLDRAKRLGLCIEKEADGSRSVELPKRLPLRNLPPNVGRTSPDVFYRKHPHFNTPPAGVESEDENQTVLEVSNVAL